MTSSNFIFLPPKTTNCFSLSSSRSYSSSSSKTTTTTTTVSSPHDHDHDHDLDLNLELDLDLVHDIGGDMAFFGENNIPPLETLLAWEQQCHALFAVLGSRQIISTDELRRAIEGLAPSQYHAWSYYEKWTAAMTILLLDEKRVITHEELQTALFGKSDTTITTTVTTIGADDEDLPPAPVVPRFKVGDSVRVLRHAAAEAESSESTSSTFSTFSSSSGVEWKRPHIRTPGYVYGVAGTIERVCGRHSDPSFLAFGLQAPTVQLYRVRFQQADIWPEQQQQQQQQSHTHTSTHTPTNDVVEVEIYQHWLEPADVSHGHDFEGHILFDHSGGHGDDCLMSSSGTVDSHDHSHNSHHDHEDHEDHEDHVHEARPTVEERAIQREGPPRPGKELFQALYALLLDKQIVSAEEVRLMCERMDTAETNLDGATLVVEAWMDDEFKLRLLQDPAAAAAEVGVSTSNPNAPTVLTVIANTPTTHNLIVCTLCSCYPSGLLGIAPSWYKSREYRARAVREPRKVLSEFGTTVSSDTSIRIHDSTADHRYIVLPERPIGTEDWSKEELRKIITRDTMIGISVPST